MAEYLSLIKGTWLDTLKYCPADGVPNTLKDNPDITIILPLMNRDDMVMTCITQNLMSASINVIGLSPVLNVLIEYQMIGK